MQHAMGLSMADAIAAVGRVDVEAAGIADLGRPDGLLERQVERWRSHLASYYLEIVRRGANLEFDFLGMSFSPMERHGEPRVVDLARELIERGHSDRLLLSQDVCHNSQLKAGPMAGMAAAHFLGDCSWCRPARAAGRTRGRDPR